MKELLKIEIVEEKQTVNARDLHFYLEVNSKFADWIKNRIEKYDFQENQDYITFSKILEKDLNQELTGRPTKEYYLSISMAKELSMVENNEKGKQARKYFIQCEQELQNKYIPMPNFSNPVEAARAWADEVEQRELAQKQRDYAIANKANIGARRETTAMNIASQKSKQVKKLQIELDISKEYASIKAVEIRTKEKYSWRKLRDYCNSNELTMKKIFDANYGEVNTYPAIAWLKVYNVEL